MTTKSYEQCLSELDRFEEEQDKAQMTRVRDEVSQNFIPKPNFWQSWLTDAFLSGDMKETTRVFDKAIKFCPKMALIEEFLEFAMNKYDEDVISEEELRESFDKCIGIAGTDMYEAQSLWQMLRNFEVSEHADILEEDGNGDTEDLRTAKIRVIDVFKRQLSLPLLGNDNVLLDFQSWLSTHCTEADTTLIDPMALNDRYEKAMGDYAIRTPFEEKLSNESYQKLSETEKLNIWRAYIQFEIDDNQMSRATRLYRRASLELGHRCEFWESFVTFAMKKLKDPKVSEEVCDSARRVCTSNVPLLRSWLLSIERNSDRGDEDVTQVFQGALTYCVQQSLPTAEDYLGIYLTQCDFFRRRLSASTTAEPLVPFSVISAVTEMRAAFDQAEAFLETYYPKWLSGWLQLLSLRALIEEEAVDGAALMISEQDGEDDGAVSTNVGLPDICSDAQKVLERLVTRFETQTVAWLEYISWLRKAGEFELCRKIYKKGLMKSTESSEVQRMEMAIEYVSFERATGTLDTFVEAESRLQVLSEKVATIAAKETKKVERDRAKGNEQEIARESVMGKKRSVDITSFSSTSVPVPLSTSAVAEEMSEPSVKRSRTDPIDSSKTAVMTSTGLNRAERRAQQQKIGIAGEQDKINVVNIEANKPGEIGEEIKQKGVFVNKSDDKCSIHIKNLSFDTTSGEIQALFCKCGSIRAVELVVSKEGKSRGIATVTFFTQAAAISAVERFHDYVFKDRNLVVRLTEEVDTTSAHPTTVFVSKLSECTTSEDLRQLFQSCGEIEEARVITDKRNGKCKGHGLVQFKNIDSMPAAFALSKTSLAGSIISVLKSKYPAKIERSDDGDLAEKRELEVKKKEITPVVVPTKVNIFKPRKVVPQGKKKKVLVALNNAAEHSGIHKESRNIDSTGTGDGAESGGKTNEDFKKLFA